MCIKKRQSVYKIGSDVEEVIVSEYGRHLEGEYVRRRLRVKALGMEEVSVAAPAGAAGLGVCQPACIRRGEGFEPSMEEKDYSVATSGHHLASERSPPCGGVAGCEEDPWAGAEAPAPSWIGATRSDPGVGQEDMLSSPSEAAEI